MHPLLIVQKIGNPIVAIIGSVTFIVATMGINIVANFVSPVSSGQRSALTAQAGE
jgi:NCS1 family nucleobase:cation symporter-1